jgi:hypothetical protein
MGREVSILADRWGAERGVRWLSEFDPWLIPSIVPDGDVFGSRLSDPPGIVPRPRFTILPVGSFRAIDPKGVATAGRTLFYTYVQ